MSILFLHGVLLIGHVNVINIVAAADFLVIDDAGFIRLNWFNIISTKFERLIV